MGKDVDKWTENLIKPVTPTANQEKTMRVVFGLLGILLQGLHLMHAVPYEVEQSRYVHQPYFNCLNTNF